MMRRNSWLTGAALAALLMGGPGSIALAQDSGGDKDLRRPELAGHRFMSTDIVKEAFVRSSFRNTLGVLQAADLKYGELVVDGDTLATFDGNLVYATLQMEYQQAIREWVAFNAELQLRTRLGTDAAALVVDGVQVNGGFDMGWLFRLREEGSTALAASVGVTRSSVTVIDIGGFVEDIVNGEDDPTLVDTVPVLRARGGGHFAWAISEPFGLQADAGLSYGEKPGRSLDDGVEYRYGLAFDCDLGEVSSVPIGLSLGYRQSSVPDQSVRSSDIVRATALGIGYNPRDNFLLYLSLFWTNARDSSLEDAVNAGGANISMRYWF